MLAFRSLGPKSNPSDRKTVKEGAALVGTSTLAEVPCPVCTETLGLIVALKDRHGRPLRTVSCARCGLMRVDPLPTANELRRFYELEYRYSYKGGHRPKSKHVYRSGLLAAERLRRLEGHLIRSKSRVLDIGCGSGEWLYMLNARGHSAIGIELDPAYAEFGRQEYGLEVRTGSVLELSMPEKGFDCITLFHVLEHLPNPVMVLRRIHRWLKDDGVLAVEVPNMNSLHQNPVKRFHYAHVVGFTPESFACAVQQCGLECVEISLDMYERNIFAVIRKRPLDGREVMPGPLGQGMRPPAPLVASIPATLGYYLRPATYSRCLERMRQFVAEFAAIRTGSTPREILQSVHKIAVDRAACGNSRESPRP